MDDTHLMCARCLWKSEGGILSIPWNWIMGGCELPFRCWKANPGPLQEWQVLLTIELQQPFCFVFRFFSLMLLLLLLLEARSLTGTYGLPFRLGWLASEPKVFSCLIFAWIRGIPPNVPPSPAFAWVLQIEFKSSCTPHKHFIGWTIPSAPTGHSKLFLECSSLNSVMWFIDYMIIVYNTLTSGLPLDPMFVFFQYVSVWETLVSIMHKPETENIALREKAIFALHLSI